MTTTLKVATLNIWNRSGPWEERLVAIRAGLAALDADLIGLQEVVRLDKGQGDGLDQAALLAASLGYHWAYARAPDEPWLGNALLSRWPIARTEGFALPGQGTDERRVLLCAEVTSPWGPIPFFVTHLNWKFDDGHVRAAQVKDIVTRMASLERAGDFPAILVGDFNAEPEADEIRYLRGLTSLGGPGAVYFQDAFAAAGDGSAGATFSRRNPHASPLREPERRIDYIFVKGRDERHRGEPLAATVCFDGPVNGVFPSDHFGVAATLRASPA